MKCKCGKEVARITISISEEGKRTEGCRYCRPLAPLKLYLHDIRSRKLNMSTGEVYNEK